MVPVQREEGANNGSVGDKLSQPKKNSYDHIREKDEKETIQSIFHLVQIHLFNILA